MISWDKHSIPQYVLGMSENVGHICGRVFLGMMMIKHWIWGYHMFREQLNEGNEKVGKSKKSDILVVWIFLLRDARPAGFF